MNNNVVKSGKKKMIIKPMMIMSREIRNELGFPFISLRSRYNCELGLRDIKDNRPEVRKVNNDYNYTYLRGIRFHLDEKCRCDMKELPVIKHIAGGVDKPIFQLKHLIIDDNRDISGFVVWDETMDPIGKELLSGDKPAFYFSPIVSGTRGDSKFDFWVLGFDVIRT